jgi:hypothetical protein
MLKFICCTVIASSLRGTDSELFPTAMLAFSLLLFDTGSCRKNAPFVLAPLPPAAPSRSKFVCIPLFLIPGVCRKNAPFLLPSLRHFPPITKALHRDIRLSSMRALRATTSPSLCPFALAVHTRFPNILLLRGSGYEPKKHSFFWTISAPEPPPHNVEVLRSISGAARSAKDPTQSTLCLGQGGGRAKSKKERFFCTTRYQNTTVRKVSSLAAGVE